MIDKAAVGDKVVRRFLAEKMDIIVSKFNPEKLILFGSRAWGNPTDESDIDLIIVSDVFNGQKFTGRMDSSLKKCGFRNTSTLSVIYRRNLTEKSVRIIALTMLQRTGSVSFKLRSRGL
jgi:predicted nucleotidyltransferase